MGLDDVAERTRETHLGGVAETPRVPARASDSGDVILVIENGFIAHKKQQKLFMPVLRSERDSVISGSAGSAVAASLNVLIRTVIVMNELGRGGQDYLQAHEDGVMIASAALSAAGVELITMAWPAYELNARRATGIRVRSGSDEVAVSPVLLGDLSVIALRDFEERKTSMMLRMLARALLKESAVVKSEQAGTSAGGALGGFAARIASRTFANATERADTRSWSGLPAELLLVRMRLPAGPNDIEISYEGARGPETRTVRIDVRAGAVSLETIAVTGRDGGDQGRFRGATRGVRHEVPRARPRAATPGADPVPALAPFREASIR
ncbi:MAG: hypothetical protein O2956_01445 [Gemmatimonadetes bacterium]|nr:hypothetical protein [Gemmatimonadota bacterium]